MTFSPKESTRQPDKAFIATGQSTSSHFKRHRIFGRVSPRNKERIQQLVDKQSSTNQIKKPYIRKPWTKRHGTNNVITDTTSFSLRSLRLQSKSRPVLNNKPPSAQALHHNSTPSFS